jgi:hypothetical protein
MNADELFEPGIDPALQPILEQFYFGAEDNDILLDLQERGYSQEDAQRMLTEAERIFEAMPESAHRRAAGLLHRHGNKPNRLPVILWVAAGMLAVFCGLIALGVLLSQFTSPYFGPKSQAILAPDHVLVSTVNPSDLEKDAQILGARSKALGAHTTFRVDAGT